MIPWVKWRGQFQPIGTPPADTVWVPGTARKWKLLFNVLFSAANVPAHGINSVSEPGDWIVGSLPLANGETVWLRARQAGMSPDERKGIASVAREYQGFQVNGDLRGIDPWESGSPQALWALRSWFSSRLAGITSRSTVRLAALLTAKRASNPSSSNLQPVDYEFLPSRPVSVTPSRCISSAQVCRLAGRLPSRPIFPRRMTNGMTGGCLHAGSSPVT